MKKTVAFWVLLSGFYTAFGQSTNLPLNEDYYALINRYQILGNGINKENHSTFRPYFRSTLRPILDSLSGTLKSRIDQFNFQYLMNDNGEIFESEDSQKPVLRHFYKKKTDLISVRTPDLDLHVNPVIDFSYGYAKNTDQPFINSRGIEIRATIDNKVGFYTFLTDNQARFPSYVRDYIAINNIVPHEAFWKDFHTDGVDFFSARGYISFNATRHINIQFGQDRFFAGNGVRSLILSDFSAPYPFLKIDTRIWKFRYTNLFTEMKADAFATYGSSRRFPNKYVALHQLSFDITKNFNIGVFETIVYGRADSLGNNPVQIGYLNPVIFYRSAEQYNGSEDNALLGFDLNYMFLHHFQVYGQFLFDEFLLSEIKANDGWWGNKYAFQIGAKYINAFGLNGVDLQIEYNQARPFTYSHKSIYTNYAHYLQPIAHPLGANFREVVGNIRIQPIPKLVSTIRIIYYMKGVDPFGYDYGGDIMKPYTFRIADRGNEVGQGIKNNVLFGNVSLSYMLKHNLFVDADLILRSVNSDLPALEKKDIALTFSLRLNIPKRLHEF